MAAIAMIVFAMALPERYDIACGAYAVALVVTMAATGEYTIKMFAARGWETMVGGALGMTVVLLLKPLMPINQSWPVRAPSKVVGAISPRFLRNKAVEERAHAR
jgi:hypothetical protein